MSRNETLSVDQTKRWTFELHEDVDRFEVSRVVSSGFTASKVVALVIVERAGSRIHVHGDQVDVDFTAIVVLDDSGACRFVVGEADVRGVANQENGAWPAVFRGVQLSPQHILKPSFRSSIPAAARARLVERHTSGAPARVEYVLRGAVVGHRDFDADGRLMLDCALRKGEPHGTTYRLGLAGTLLSATPYRNGLEHGVARQWSDDGRLIGSYRMRSGTGVDLWWQQTWTNPRRRYLAEVHFQVRGRPHGYEWWLNDDQVSVHQERHWWNGELHGIEREWNAKGQLRRGFPRFYVHGARVTRRVYTRARRRATRRSHRFGPPTIGPSERSRLW